MGVTSSFIQHDKGLKYIEDPNSASDLGSQSPWLKSCWLWSSVHMVLVNSWTKINSK